MKSILIIEDEILVARSTEAILSGYGYHIVGIATNGKQARTTLLQNKVDLILCDINLNEEKTGIDLMKEIKSKSNIPFIFITSYSDKPTLELADKLNPQSYLTKPYSEKQLIASVNRVFMNQPVLESKPTEREMDILLLISKGLNSTTIAEKLNISVYTVESHRRNLFQKYKVKTMPELICLATSKNWIAYESIN